MEEPARGLKGHLLWNPFEKSYFFRVYDPEDKSKFEDYDLAADDIEIEILDRFVVLRDGKLNWSKRVVTGCE